MLRSALRSAIVLPLLAGPAASVPLTYDFVHSGFSEGARVEGHFTGEDLNGNGYIQTSSAGNPEEVTSFSLVFTGNSLVPALEMPRPRDFTLVYVLGSGGFANSLIPGYDAVDGLLTRYDPFPDGAPFTQEYDTGLVAYPFSDIDCRDWPPCGAVYFEDGATTGVDFSQELATVTPAPDPPAPVPLPPSGAALFAALGALGLAGTSRRRRDRRTARSSTSSPKRTCGAAPWMDTCDA